MKAKELYLPLKEKWYRMIESGEKREEYREITPYWAKRLLWDNDYDEPLGDLEANMEPGLFWNAVFAGCFRFRDFTHVHFTLGYPKRDDASRHMVKKIEKMEVAGGRPEWGAEVGKEYFVIKLED
jgi:hypothetical protein